MNEPRIQLLDDLHGEFARIGHEHEQKPRWRRKASRWRRAVLAVPLALVFASAAVGAVVVLDEPDDTSGLFGAEERLSLAQGTTTEGGKWLLATAREGQSFCLSLRVAAPGASPQASVNCGGMTPNTFFGTIGDSGSTQLLYGTAPDRAATVRTVPDQGPSRDTTVVDDPHGLPGKFYVVELGDADAADLRVTLLDAGGQPLAAPTTANLLIKRSSPLD